MEKTEGTISPRISSLLGKGLDPYVVVQLLQAEGCEVEADGSGYVRVSRGRERCNYPLNVTQLPTQLR